MLLSSIQCINTFNRIYKHGTNLSWYYYKDLWKYHKDQVKDEVHLLFNDRKNNVKAIISPLKINGFLSSDCDGYIRLLFPNTPIYNVTSYGSREEFIKDFEKNVIDTFSQKHNLYFLSRSENVEQKINDLKTRNYSIDTIVNIYPYFTTPKMPLYLIKIKHYPTDSSK